MPKIFDKETIDLLRSLIKAQDKKIPIVEEKNIGELPSLARHIIVDASINKSEIADIISCYKYVFKVQNILVCVEYDGYTLYEVKL